ncbi:hypothetical protein Slala05_17730 [Streptomyces lavendulae subsp. lavendulae]|nr:hypothetical protein Slala05_17730 [Streptomyces lavendulae subsp. lavendulae]
MGGDDDFLGHALGLDGLAQGGDDDGHLRPRGGRRPAVPHYIDKCVNWHNPPGTQEQKGQNRTLPGTSYQNRPLPHGGHKWTKNSEAETLTQWISPRH